MFGVETVTGTGDTVKGGFLVELLHLLGIGIGNHLVGIAVDNEDRFLVCLSQLEGVHVKDFLEILAAHGYAPQTGGIGHLVERGITCSPMIRDAESGEHQHKAANLLLIGSCRERRDQSSLAFAQQDDAFGVYVGLTAEVFYHGLQLSLLVENGHIHGILVRTAEGRTAGKVEGISLIAKAIECIEIIAVR